MERKGITQAIAKLAAERFADSNKAEMLVEMDTRLVMNDLQKGEDSFTGKPLPILGRFGLPRVIWTQISTTTERALIDCATSVIPKVI